MGLKHVRATVGAICLAALTAFQASAQEGGPPGSEAPAEMGNVETVIVSHDWVRCPNGTRVALVEQCLPNVSIPNSWIIANFDPSRPIIVDFADGVQVCGEPADANCKCVTGKVKAYDEENDTFHCKAAPPGRWLPEVGSDVRLRPRGVGMRDETAR